MSLLHHHDPKLDRLHALELFEHADKRALRHLASAADELHVPEGTTLFTEGHRCHEAYLVTSGLASVEVHGEKVAEVGAGEMVGELALFCHCSAGGTVRAETEMDVLAIPYNRFDQILHENPDLATAIAKQLACRLLELNSLYEGHEIHDHAHIH